MSGFLAPFYFQQFRDGAGRPLANGTLTFSVTDSDVPKAVYSDFDCQNAFSNPLPLDSNGYAPEFFLTSGFYRCIIKDYNGILVATRDRIAGAVASTSDEFVDSFKLKVNSSDSNPGFLSSKILNSDSITWTVSANGAMVGNVSNSFTDSYKVKATSSDSSPDFLSGKISTSDTISLSISSDKIKADYIGNGGSTVGITSSDSSPDYLSNKILSTDSITWTVSGDKLRADVQDIGKIKITSGDTLQYLEDKIQAGSGIVFTETEDINGKKIHISTTLGSGSSDYGKVKVTSADSSPGFLVDKISGTNGISVSSVGNSIVISNNYPGEKAYLSAALPFTSAVTTSSTASFALLTLTLSAGTWDVAGNVLCYITPSGGTNVAGINSNINTSNTFVNDGFDSYATLFNDTTAKTITTPLTSRRYVVTSSQTVYLVSQCRFGLFSSASFWGSMTAEQVA